MRPLTLDDLLPLGDFASQRRELFAAHCRYLDRYRRVRIGPRLTLLFENRQTLWFRVQDLLRIARLTEPARVREELKVYNRLLPGKNCLQASLLIDIAHEARLEDELEFWRKLPEAALRLRLGEHVYPAELITCRPEDRCFGAAQWLRFTLDAAARDSLVDSRLPAYFEVKDAAYPHQSPPLASEIRQSLLEDLQMSDRDAA